MTDSPRSETGPSGETPNIVADARVWLQNNECGPMRTHSDRCHQYHQSCLIQRLADLVERQTVTPAELDAIRDVAAWIESHLGWYQTHAKTLRSLLARLRPATPPAIAEPEDDSPDETPDDPNDYVGMGWIGRDGRP